MIGDELLVDIKIPKKLGMHTILLDRSNEFKKKPSEADRKAKTLIDAMTIIEKMANKKMKPHLLSRAPPRALQG